MKDNLKLNIKDFITTCSDFINNATDKGGKVFVHWFFKI